MLGPRKFIFVFVSYIAVYFSLVNGQYEDPEEEPEPEAEPESSKIKIGALFDVNVNENKQFFQFAIEQANEKLLKDEEFQLEGQVADITFGNEVSVSRALCGLLEEGVSAIFGPYDPLSAIHASNICDTKEIPYIDTRSDAYSVLPIINMYPDPESIAQMVTDLVVAAEWESFTILYETPEWLPHLAPLLELYDPKGHTVTVRRIDVGLPVKDFRAVLRRVKDSSDTSILIECSADSLPEILKQAQQIGLIIDKYQYIITGLDAHTIDLEPFQYSGANITVIHLVDTSNAVFTAYAEYLKKNAPEEEKPEGEGGEEEGGEGEAANEEAPENPEESPNEDEGNEEKEEGDEDKKEEEEEKAEEEPADVFDPETMRLQTALVYDGIMLLADSFKQLGVEQIQPINIYCMGNESMWEKGLSISNFMRNTVVESGVTGSVKFSENGRRSEFVANIFQLSARGLTKISTWSPETGIQIDKDTAVAEGGLLELSLKNMTFIVLTSLTEPYGMFKEASLELTGNERFEGFGIDLIHELSLILGFKYEFRLQEDGKYGNKNNVTKEWDGMIGQLRAGTAHLAITDLTITSERESGADFTMPFMNLGIAVLYRKPTKQPPSTFSFMSPFSTGVWMFLGVAYFATSIVLFVLGRLAPAEWDNPYPCIEEPTELENQFSFANAMWFCIGALLQQGSEIAPKAPATRIAASIWWFFTLIMVSSYTANLAAFLTIEMPYERIKSVEDLKGCDDPNFECPVTFGAKAGGATFNFFKESEHPTYHSMYEYMNSHPEMMTKDNNEGLRRAQHENYAFLMESSSIEYLGERHCNITQIGGPLDDKGYGIAMKQNSWYRNALSEGVLRLQESGKLAILKIKWWKEKKGGGACSGEAEGGAIALEMANVVGVFYLTIIGVVIAIIIAFILVVLETRTVCKENKEDNGSDAQALNMENVNGVFYVLFGGCLIATISGYIEFCLICYKTAKKAKISFKEEFLTEMKFILKCESNTKVVRHRKSESIDSGRSVTSYRSNQSHANSEIDHGNRSTKSSRQK